MQDVTGNGCSVSFFTIGLESPVYENNALFLVSARRKEKVNTNVNFLGR